MRGAGTRAVIWAAALGFPLAAAADTGRFDGTWLTAISCDSLQGGRYYVLHFTSTVKDSVLHGQYGTAGEPRSLQLDGRIAADGGAMLHAVGRSGDAGFTPGRALSEGTPYAYDIDAHFQGSTGTGSRTAGRPCKLQMERQ